MASVSETSPKIGLALSGGGIRAAAFHAGVLLYLAETKKLELVTHISTVSGGTLLAGLIYHHSKYTWPSSLLYENFIYPQIREILSSHCMQTDLIKKALKLSRLI